MKHSWSAVEEHWSADSVYGFEKRGDWEYFDLELVYEIRSVMLTSEYEFPGGNELAPTQAMRMKSTEREQARIAGS